MLRDRLMPGANLAAAASLTPVPRLAPAAVESRLVEWRRLLRQSTTHGRAVLPRVIKGRITCTPPDGDVYSFRTDTRFEGMLDRVRPSWLSDGDVRDAEDIPADDTLDGDDGWMLDRLATASKNALGVATLARTGPFLVRGRVP
jgi:hypothetical protein